MTCFALPIRAQDDRLVNELIRMAEDKSPEDGFCSRAPWRTAGDLAQHLFLERAVVGTDEAAKFDGGPCSYTRVTDTYRGRYGKCVRYTWWACEPGKTCATGKTLWCKDRDGVFKTQ